MIAIGSLLLWGWMLLRAEAREALLVNRRSLYQVLYYHPKHFLHKAIDNSHEVTLPWSLSTAIG